MLAHYNIVISNHNEIEISMSYWIVGRKYHLQVNSFYEISYFVNSTLIEYLPGVCYSKKHNLILVLTVVFLFVFCYLSLEVFVS